MSSPLFSCVIPVKGASPFFGDVGGTLNFCTFQVERVGGCGEIFSGYGGRLLYLKGYRDGSDETRVELLKKAPLRGSASPRRAKRKIFPELPRGAFAQGASGIALMRDSLSA